MQAPLELDLGFRPLECDANSISLTTATAEPLSVEEVFRCHHGSLIAFLRQRLRNPEDALDVAQETYIRMIRYEGSAEIQSPLSFMFRIAINVANDLGRSQQVRHNSTQVSIDDVDLVSPLPSPERELSSQQELQLLYAAINRLPPKCQQVFLLSRVRGMTYPEISRHCDISVKTVEKHISRALSFCL